MRRRWVLAATAVSGAATVAACAWLPWAWYADSLPLTRFPGWGWYAGPAAGLHALLLVLTRGPGVWAEIPGTGHLLTLPTIHTLVRPAGRRWALAVGAALWLTSVGAAVLVVGGYDEPRHFFGTVVPMVNPAVGPGCPVALAAALVAGAALLGAVARLRAEDRLSRGRGAAARRR